RARSCRRGLSRNLAVRVLVRVDTPAPRQRHELFSCRSDRSAEESVFHRDADELALGDPFFLRRPVDLPAQLIRKADGQRLSHMSYILLQESHGRKAPGLQVVEQLIDCAKLKR